MVQTMLENYKNLFKDETVIAEDVGLFNLAYYNQINAAIISVMLE